MIRALKAAMQVERFMSVEVTGEVTEYSTPSGPGYSISVDRAELFPHEFDRAREALRTRYLQEFVVGPAMAVAVFDAVWDAVQAKIDRRRAERLFEKQAAHG